MPPTEYPGGARKKRFDGASNRHQHTFEEQKHKRVAPGRRTRAGRKQPNYDRVKDILCRFALAIEAEENKST